MLFVLNFVSRTAKVVKNTEITKKTHDFQYISKLQKHPAPLAIRFRPADAFQKHRRQNIFLPMGKFHFVDGKIAKQWQDHEK